MSVEVPLPWPDELVFSAIARAQRRLMSSQRDLSRSLFDDPTMVVRPHLCTRLDFVARRLQERAEWHQDATQLREENTLAPLALPYLPERNREKCVAALHEDNPRVIYIGVARSALGVTPFSRLRFCPLCRKHDLRDDVHGEAYWHRAHQIPALKICHEHKVALHETAVGASPEDYVALDAIEDGKPISLTSQSMALQLKMAESVWEVLNNPPKAFERQRLSAAYLAAMAAGGHAVGVAWLMKNDLRKFFGDQALRDADAPLDGQYDEWLKNFLAPSAPGTIRTDLYALLAARLELRLSQLLERAAHTPLLEHSPWPCMNPACPDYRKLTVVKKTRSAGARHWRFRCQTCFVTYTREDPLVRRPDGYFDHKVITRTAEWYEEFKKAWADPALGWADLRKRFNLTWNRLAQIAVQLDLKDVGDRHLTGIRNRQSKHALARDRAAAIREKYRAEWHTLHQQPAETGTHLERAAKIKKWLLQFDRSWIMQNSSAYVRPKFPPRPKSDWAAIDQDWLQLARAALPEAVEALRATHPLRIGVQALRSALAQTRQRAIPRAVKIPKTTEFIMPFVETAEQARARRSEIKFPLHSI